MGKLRLRERQNGEGKGYRTGTQTSIFTFQDLCLFHLAPDQFPEAVVTHQRDEHGQVSVVQEKNPLQLLFLMHCLVLPPKMFCKCLLAYELHVHKYAMLGVCAHNFNRVGSKI